MAQGDSMAPQPNDPRDVDRMQPLLRAVGLEIAERTKTIRELQERRSAFRGTSRIHAADIAAIEGELDSQRRELNRVQKELARLGVYFDAQTPWVAPRFIDSVTDESMGLPQDTKSI
jgi:septal ring factor EnvC (AmiA/AmiB activator)